VVLYNVAGWIRARRSLRLQRRRRSRRSDERTTLLQGLDDVEPGDVIHSLGVLVDIPGVAEVCGQKDSDVVYVLTEEWVKPSAVRVVEESVQRSIPIGLSARVVTKRNELPEGCVVMAKGWRS
jgi:hypothetical protein